MKNGEEERDVCYEKCATKSGNLVKKVEMGDIKMGKLVEEVLMNDQKIGEVEKSVKCGQEECKKHEKNVMIAGVSDEDKFVKCLDDIIGRESPWQAVKQAREKELKYLRELWSVRKRR